MSEKLLKGLAAFGVALGFAGSLGSGSARADFTLADFENGLDPNVTVRQDNGGPNTFNGSQSVDNTKGAMSGNFSTASGWQQYIQYETPTRGAGTGFEAMGQYRKMAVDITVPAGTVPSSYFVYEMIINGADGFGFVTSGNRTPVGGSNADLKGAGTVTLEWDYRSAIANFDSKYAALAADSGGYFQLRMVANYGNGWDGGSFNIDNWRFIDAVPEPASLGLIGAAACGLLARSRRRKA